MQRCIFFKFAKILVNAGFFCLEFHAFANSPYSDWSLCIHKELYIFCLQLPYSICIFLLKDHGTWLLFQLHCNYISIFDGTYSETKKEMSAFLFYKSPLFAVQSVFLLYLQLIFCSYENNIFHTFYWLQSWL